MVPIGAWGVLPLQQLTVKGMLYAIFRFLLFYIKVKILFRFLFISKNRG